MGNKFKLISLLGTIVFVLFIYGTFPAYPQSTDIPITRDLGTESVEYTDNVPYYLRKMVPNRVLFYEGHPPLREFTDIFIKNEEKSLFKRKYLTGDWGGFRTKLNNAGITPTLTYVTDIQGNPVGGDKKGFRYFHNIGLDIVFDMEKLAGWKGGRFHISASQRSGSSLTRRDIKNTFNVAQVCCGDTYKLVDVSYQQSLFEDKLNISFGRISGGDEFLSSPLYWLFVQNGIDGNPVGIFHNVGFSAYPNATWGVRVRTQPTKDFYIMAGLYNANPERVKNSKHGVDLSFDDPYLIIAETGHHLNEFLNSPGLPGNYKIGAYYQTGNFNNFTKPGATKNGNFGFYILLDQMIYKEKGGVGLREDQGLHPFVSLLFAPDSDINTFPFFLNGGLVYKGLIPRRDKDRAGFAIVYGKYSDKIKPDVQYVIKPGGTGEIPNALVLGFQLSVSI